MTACGITICTPSQSLFLYTFLPAINHLCPHHHDLVLPMRPTHPSITDLASVPQSQRPQQHLGSLQTGDHNMSSMDAREMLAQLLDTSHAKLAWAVRHRHKYAENSDDAKIYHQLA